MAGPEGFDSNFDEDYDSTTLPQDAVLLGHFVTDKRQHQARIWLLLAIESYKPTRRGFLRPSEIIQGLHDILPAYRDAVAKWLKVNEDVPRWKTGIPWLYGRKNPLFSDLRALIEAWALKYNLTFENCPAEWILEHAKQNLEIWEDPSNSPNWKDGSPHWGYLDNFVGEPQIRGDEPQIRGEWIAVFYNPLSMTHRDAQAQFDDQIKEIDA